MKLKFLTNLLMAMFFAVFSGALIATAVGLPILPVSGGLFAISLIPNAHASHLCATVYREVWSKELIKTVDDSLTDSFLDGITDVSRYVTGDEEAQIIHNTYFGVEPDVLINNTTYPIDVQTLDGEDKTITLDKYQTKATPITDDELHALAYDKIAAVKDSHAKAIVRNRLAKAIHAFGPASHTANTPVLVTTGAITPDGTRRRLQWVDIIRYREVCSSAGISLEGMRIVLCPDHVNDLVLEDKDTFKVLTDWKKGVVNSQLGFEIRAYTKNPYYNVSTKTKLSFGGTVTSAHRQATVVFVPELARKASGIVKMYYSKAETDPLNQRNLVNFRTYFIVLPMLSKGCGAIVSDIPEAAPTPPTPAVSGEAIAEFVAAGSVVHTAITATGTWHAYTAASWLTLTQVNNALMVAAAANLATARSATITLYLDSDPTVTGTISITQAAA